MFLFRLYGVAYTRYANRTYGYFTLFSHGLLKLSFFFLDDNFNCKKRQDRKQLRATYVTLICWKNSILMHKLAKIGHMLQQENVSRLKSWMAGERNYISR